MRERFRTDLTDGLEAEQPTTTLGGRMAEERGELFDRSSIRQAEGAGAPGQVMAATSDNFL